MAKILNINVEILQADCVFGVTGAGYYHSLRLVCFFPAMAALALLGLYGLLRLFRLCFPNSSSVFFRHRLFVNVGLAVLMLTYNFIVTKTVSLFSCADIADGISRLNAVPSLDCGSEEWVAAVPWAVGALAVIGLGFPAVMAIALLRLRNASTVEEFSEATALVTYGYKLSSACVIWEAVEMWKRLAVMLVIVFVGNVKDAAGLLMLVHFVFMALCVYCQPFIGILVNCMLMLMEAALFLVLLCAVVNGYGLSEAVSVIVIMCIVFNCGMVLFELTSAMISTSERGKRMQTMLKLKSSIDGGLGFVVNPNRRMSRLAISVVEASRRASQLVHVRSFTSVHPAPSESAIPLSPPSPSALRSPSPAESPLRVEGSTEFENVPPGRSGCSECARRNRPARSEAL